ncbi:MAG: geranylgeranylglycerol-phosphate geranylgeranyltransferase [Candidatus Helarchaeota archaeon]|nr:geranylgeranylglycerol-phosphate geranylgeranyltransferase [Candidatus Helarchaeota archaeon]
MNYYILRNYYKKSYGIILLLRPVNILITFISVFIGAWVGGNIYPLEKLFYACLSAALICGGGNVLNDYFDAESDMINKPNRPIPSGIICKLDALIFWIIISIIGFSISFFISLNGVFIAATAVILLFLYSSFIKNTILIGNIIISFLTGLAFIYGGEAVGNIEGAYIPAIFAFLFHFGREIIKDAEDIEGDSAAKLCTFPIKYGIKKSIYFVTAVFVFLSLLTLYPYLFLEYSLVYLLIVVFGVDLTIFYVIYLLFKNPDKYSLRRVNNILKGDMLIGLLALYLK